MTAGDVPGARGRDAPPRVVRRHPVAPPAVGWITRTLEEAGFETWAVGGAVRDVMLGVDSVDWDFATRARPEQVLKLFKRTIKVGIDHGTVGVLARDGTLYEVTTFRKDVETHGRHATVAFAERLEDDLSRRDFTINAVAWHPLRDELRDPFGGVEDLERGVLRTVGEPAERFAEDYLRVLRALRFAGRFGLTIERPTWEALRGATGRLGILSPERVREELLKVLGADATPSRALDLYERSGVLAALMPELAELVGMTRPDRPVEAWRYGVAVAEALSRRRPLLRLVALLQGAGARAAAQLVVRLRFSNTQADQVAGMVAAGLGPPSPTAAPAELRRWLARVGPERVRDLARVWCAQERVDRRLRVREPMEALASVRALRAQLRARHPLAVGDLAIGGNDLIKSGLKPGPRFGHILDALLERVLEDPALNRRDTLLEMARRLAE